MGFMIFVCVWCMCVHCMWESPGLSFSDFLCVFLMLSISVFILWVWSWHGTCGGSEDNFGESVLFFHHAVLTELRWSGCCQAPLRTEWSRLPYAFFFWRQYGPGSLELDWPVSPVTPASALHNGRAAGAHRTTPCFLHGCWRQNSGLMLAHRASLQAIIMGDLSNPTIPYSFFSSFFCNFSLLPR